MRRLILRPGAIGDCLLALPALEHLSCGECEIWISTAVAPLIENARSLAGSGIEMVGLPDRPVPHELAERLATFDSIVSWYGANRPEFRAAMSGLHARCEFLAALPPEEFAGHATDFFAGQVGAGAGLSAKLKLCRTEPRGSIVLHPFSGSARKNWPLASFRDLAKALPFPVEWAVDVAGRIRFENLRELAEWLTGARLYIGNDSGITHLAAAAGVPTLALFGLTDPAKWAPRGPNVRVLRAEKLDALAVGTVLDAVRDMASSRAGVIS